MIRRYKDGMLELDVTIFRNAVATRAVVQPVLVSSWTLVQRLCCDRARGGTGALGGHVGRDSSSSMSWCWA